MKLTIHNKLVILKKKYIYIYIVLLFITKFIWIIIVHFLYILCFGYIYYILLLFIYMIKIGNWQLPSLKNLSPQLLFFSILFSFLVAKDGHG